MLMRNGEADRPGTGAEIDDDGRASFLDLREHRFNDDFGLRPRNEHARPDLQVEITEAGGSDEVLQRRPLRTLSHELLEVALGLRGVPLERACVMLRARDACPTQ